MFTIFDYLKESKPLQDRIKLSSDLRKKYPDTVPVIVQRSEKEIYLPEIDKKQFLVPISMTLGNFISIIAYRLETDANSSLWLYSSRIALTNRSESVSQIYNRYRDIDGFLYLKYKSEESFGL